MRKIILFTLSWCSMMALPLIGAIAKADDVGVHCQIDGISFDGDADTTALAVGSAPLSQEPTWKSVVKLPKQQDSAITTGDFVFTHFEPGGDHDVVGTVQFQTIDGPHRGQCRLSR